MPLRIHVHASVEAAAADLDRPDLAGYAFQRSPWLMAAQDTLGAAAGVEPAIVVVSDTRVRLVVPLAIARRRGVRVLEFLGGLVTDYNAPLVDAGFARRLDASAMGDLWARIRDALPAHDRVQFGKMPATLDSDEDVAPVPNPFALLAEVAKEGRARSATLAPSYDAFLKQLRPKFATDTKRRLRRLAERGAVELHVAQTPAEREAVLHALKRMKSRRWRDTGAKDWFADPAFARFHDGMIGMALPGGTVHASLLTVGGEAVAGHLGLGYRGRFYLLLLGWEAGDWVRFSTGRLVVDALLRQAIADGYRVFDFTVGEEAYKEDWTDTDLPLLRLEQAVSARGQLDLAARRTLAAVRARAKRNPWLRGTVRRLRGQPPLAEAEQRHA